MKAESFKIDIAEALLIDLKDRLKRTRWPDEFKDPDWDYGTNLEYMKALVSYWQTAYDWRKHETKLNRFAQFKTKINDIEIHFIHERGKGSNSLPIILTHGWPDSFLRFEKIIPMLTDPAAFGGDPADAFDVVVPSLPGFGFSDTPEPDGNIFKVHELWATLMTDVLGYKHFAAHGGDWGSIVTEHLGRSHSKLLTGIHLTDVPFIHIFQKPDDLSDAEKRFFAESEHYQMTENAYAMVQGTRPQTLAAGLNDSPVGLAAWIVEKFQSMSDCDGDIERCFSKDELLTNISLYWFTQSIPSSFMPYYEILNAGTFTWIGEKIKEWTGSTHVPAGFAMFHKENSHTPKEWAERFFNVQHWSNLQPGGHFAALEQPALLAEDIRTFFRSRRSLSDA